MSDVSIKFLRLNLIQLQTHFTCDLNDNIESIETPRYLYSDTICSLSPETKIFGSTQHKIFFGDFCG